MLGRYRRAYAMHIAECNKNKFRKQLFKLPEFLNDKPNLQPSIEIISMSGDSQFLDQLFCITSFLNCVGKPGKWTIYSDGSHTEYQKGVFNSLDFVEFIQNPQLSNRIPRSFTEKYPFLKRLEYYSAHQRKFKTTIFCDSDILFFDLFNKRISVLIEGNWYLPDEDFVYFDKEYLALDKPFMFSVNAGFFILDQFKESNWDIAFDYITSRIKNSLTIGHWTEQTAIHQMIQSAGNFYPLDPRIFVLNGNDSFLIKCIDPAKMAIRHFVGPIRHKMWQYPIPFSLH